MPKSYATTVNSGSAAGSTDSEGEQGRDDHPFADIEGRTGESRGVDQHRMVLRELQQNGIPLPDVEKRHAKMAARDPRVRLADVRQRGHGDDRGRGGGGDERRAPGSTAQGQP